MEINHRVNVKCEAEKKYLFFVLSEASISISTMKSSITRVKGEVIKFESFIVEPLFLTKSL